ncbi:MAG TPA: phosphoenolpyruvate synthase [Patescibacteria group bacterium]|nr:phosphoenolpyruvate synthase [Patescibacteria group bacterium]
MVRPHDLVVSLRDVDRDDTRFVGGKGANLGEMISAGLPVPPGFVITANAYQTFLKENSLDKKIASLIESINFQSTDSLVQVSGNIRKLIVKSEIPPQITKEVFKFYSKIDSSSYVAIRSSATSEDSKEDSFAGQNETYLNIKGEANLCEKIRLAWASLFEPRSIFYRHERKLSHAATSIALVVEKMIESESSGVIFTVDPLTGNKNRIIIEAIFGLGEYIVQGRVTPDHYEVDKSTFNIVKNDISEQKVMLKKDHEKNKEVSVPLLKRKHQKIRDFEIIALAKIADKIEKHYYFPQDIEWAKEDGKLFIVQTRPITTLEKKNDESKVSLIKSDLKPLAKSDQPIVIGSPASPGIGVGKVVKISGPKEISKIKKGDILVAKMTNPDYVPAMKIASAIITEEGGRTSHAAIVSREFGIPAVVGASRCLSLLKDGDIVTVNGKTGEIYKGGFLIRQEIVKSNSKTLKTATKLLVNMAEPELAKDIAARDVDGIGLLRAEFMIAQIGVHPKKLINDGKSKYFVDKLANGIGEICKSFYPRPVLYRATDFKSNEYATLVGGKQFEPIEANPMIGYRGTFRYIHDKRVFDLELEAIKKVREKMGMNNLNLMLPFVRTVRELSEAKKIINASGLRRSHTFKLYMMVEVPSNVILIDEFIKEGIDGVSIGSNDLTMLILGVDRDNQEVAPEFDERNPAIMWALERTIKAAKKNGIPVSICGQAPSVYPSLVDDLVSWGIDSISVSPDAIENTRRLIYSSEGRIVRRAK